MAEQSTCSEMCQKTLDALVALLWCCVNQNLSAYHYKPVDPLGKPDLCIKHCCIPIPSACSIFQFSRICFLRNTVFLLFNYKVYIAKYSSCKFHSVCTKNSVANIFHMDVGALLDPLYN